MMSEAMSVLQVRTPPPRQLGAKETLDTLTHWYILQEGLRLQAFYQRNYYLGSL